MSNLLSVADFAKQDQSGKWNTPQKINYAIRKQNAPTTTGEDGKRRIDPEAWKEWEESGVQIVRKAKSEGLSAGGIATRVQKRTGVSKGSMLAWKSGMNQEKISAGRVERTSEHYASTQIDSTGINSPLSWEAITKHIDEGNMMVVNHPDQLLYVLAQHYKGQGEEDTYNELMKLHAKHKTFEVGTGYANV